MATPVSKSSARKRNNDESILVVTNIYLSRKAAGHFQTVTNSDLRLQTSDSEHEQEQERCIRASSFLRHSSFACQAVALAKAGASSFVCPLLLSELPKTATGKVQKYVFRGKPAISKQ